MAGAVFRGFGPSIFGGSLAKRRFGESTKRCVFQRNACPKPKSYRKVSSANGRVPDDEFMTNARVGRTRIGVDVSCDVRYGMML